MKYTEHCVEPFNKHYLICTDCQLLVELNGKQPFSGVIYESKKAFHYRPDPREKNTFAPCTPSTKPISGKERQLLFALIEAKKELEYHNWQNTKTYNLIVEAIKQATE